MVEFRKSPFQSFAVSGENRQVKPAVNIRRVVFSFFVGSGADLEDGSKESFVFALIVGKDPCTDFEADAFVPEFFVFILVDRRSYLLLLEGRGISLPLD